MLESISVLVLVVVAIIFGFFSSPMFWAVLLGATAIPIVDAFISLCRMKKPLEIQTPDGSNEPFHPSVVFFEKPWRGYHYWMAFTPYPVNKPPYRDRWECPCVVASNDGIHWEYPGACTFLDDLTEEQIQFFDYFSDTHLIYDAGRDALYCYYRLNEGKKPERVTIFRKETVDGKNWSERIALSYPENVDALEPLSQSVTYHNGMFSMWYVAHSGDPNGVYMVESKDGLAWDGNKKCVLSGADVTPWHIDCQHIDGYYYLTVYELSQKITLWSSFDGENFTFVRCLLTIPGFGDCGLFYNNILYRACLVNNGEEFRVYFAGGNKKRNSIGYMAGQSVQKLRIPSRAYKKQIKMFLYDWLYKYTYFERLVMHKLLGR